jgi:succinate-semialdehyde dehydrogenase/glutarate-semialdehyde dehydrogenase
MNKFKPQSKNQTVLFRNGKKLYDDRAVLHKVAELVRERKTDLAKLITLEMGKNTITSRMGVNLSDILDYADNGAAFLADKTPESGEAFIRNTP